MGHSLSTARSCHPIWVRARNGCYGVVGSARARSEMALGSVRARWGVVLGSVRARWGMVLGSVRACWVVVRSKVIDKATVGDLEMQLLDERQLDGMSVYDLRQHLISVRARVKALVGEAHEGNHPSQRKKRATLILYYAILAFSTAGMFSLWTGARNPSRGMLLLEGGLFTMALVVTSVIQEQCLRLATAALCTAMLTMGYSFRASLYAPTPAPTPAPAALSG